MKCVITGHTRGLGKALYQHFHQQGWEVVGLSASNGYHMPDALTSVVAAANGCDLFINNTFAEGHQVDLVHALKYKVKRMVVCGSIARLYPMNEILVGKYADIKTELARVCQLLSINNDPTLANILHLDLSFLEGGVENPLEPMEFVSDHVIKFEEVIAGIELWLKYPKIRQIEFSWKLTPFLEPRLKRASSSNHAPLNKLINDLNET